MVEHIHSNTLGSHRDLCRGLESVTLGFEVIPYLLVLEVVSFRDLLLVVINMQSETPFQIDEHSIRLVSLLVDSILNLNGLFLLWLLFFFQIVRRR